MIDAAEARNVAAIYGTSSSQAPPAAGTDPSLRVKKTERRAREQLCEDVLHIRSQAYDRMTSINGVVGSNEVHKLRPSMELDVTSVYEGRRLRQQAQAQLAHVNRYYVDVTEAMNRHARSDAHFSRAHQSPGHNSYLASLERKRERLKQESDSAAAAADELGAENNTAASGVAECVPEAEPEPEPAPIGWGASILRGEPSRLDRLAPLHTELLCRLLWRPALNKLATVCCTSIHR